MKSTISFEEEKNMQELNTVEDKLNTLKAYLESKNMQETWDSKLLKLACE